MPFSFYDDPAIGSRGHAPSFSIEGDLGNGGGATGKDGGGNPPRERSFSQIFDTPGAGGENLFGELGDDAVNEFRGHAFSIDGNDDWKAPVTYPSIIDDGADPVVWRYFITWNETKYNADNTKGWEATKSNDESETPTKYNWNGTAWVSE